jgi:hypothetical protein
MPDASSGARSDAPDTQAGSPAAQRDRSYLRLMRQALSFECSGANFTRNRRATQCAATNISGTNKRNPNGEELSHVKEV